jgi:hypothetical protein
MTTNNSGYYGPFVPPQEPDVGAPRGHGQPHAPSGGFTVEAQDLVNAAAAWDGASAALRKAWSLTQEGWGCPGIFGMHDTLFTAGRLHMLVNQVVVNGCADGSAFTGLLADGLVATANDFSNTDTTQGEAFRVLEGRAGE